MRNIALAAGFAAWTAAAATVALAAGAALAPGDMVGKDETSLRAALTEKGYEVRKIESEDGEMEAYALKDGKRYEIYVDPKTGAVSKVKSDD